MPDNLCVIHILIHDPSGDSEGDESISIIVKELDFDRINKDIEGRIGNDMITTIHEVDDYITELESHDVYVQHVSKFYLHDVMPP
jgi:hypothetical protein